ncbi:MAG: methionyl-tRNA formyltransferase [Clostridiales bacterium]|nr:methionyl-tRNA formyltransferase [Clostridiales bacterium]
MKVLFMGTPDFAVASLKRIMEDGHEVCAVFTREDKPQGRGLKIFPPPVKSLALEHHIPVYQPKNLSDQEYIEKILDEKKPEVIIVVAYGRLLPSYVLDYPKYGCLNVHGSLLPKYRGAAPIQRAVMNGEKVTGITTMYMSEMLDAGDIILKKETQIGPQETTGELFDRLSAMGAELLSETLTLVEKGTAPRIPQDHALATLAPMIRKEDARIHWNKSPEEVVNLIRGTNPYPTAYFMLHDQTIKVYSAKVSGNTRHAPSGTVIENNDDHVLEIACLRGESIYLEEIQVQGGRRMRIEDYLRGHKIPAGTIVK